MSNSVALILGILLLAGNAFFVGAEFAVMSVRHAQVEPLVKEGRRGATKALYAIEHVSEMLAAAQFGVTVCSVSLGAVAEPAIAHLIEVPLEALHVPGALLHPISFVIALGIATYLHVVLGEMVPKNISISVPTRAVLLLAPPLVLLSKVLKPLIGTMNAIANAVLRLMRIEPKDEVESAYTADQVAAIVDESQKEGKLHDDDGLLAGALEFSDRRARDVMVPTDEVVSVTYQATPADVEELVAKTGYSRFGVTNDAGDLVGYLHLKDILLAVDAPDTDYDSVIPPGRVRAVVSVGEDDEIETVLREMQRQGAHLARVDSNQGPGAGGVVFLEDVLELLVGEVNDEMQREGRPV